MGDASSGVGCCCFCVGYCSAATDMSVVVISLANSSYYSIRLSMVTQVLCLCCDLLCRPSPIPLCGTHRWVLWKQGGAGEAHGNNRTWGLSLTMLYMLHSYCTGA